MTWNVEGHQPLDQDEVIPQLAYLAFAMMKAGVQTVSLRRLREVLTTARSEMPEILGCARMGIPEFIQQVELRSSLLMLSGHVVENGVLYATYEFRHLAFQEYLVARAIVDGHYIDRTEGDGVLGVLMPHLMDERWNEVVPLCAVLAGRQVHPLLTYLIERCRALPRPERLPRPVVGKDEYEITSGLLVACLADEVQASPELVREAMRWVLRAHLVYGLVERIAATKYGAMLYEVGVEEFTNSSRDLVLIGSNLIEISEERIGVDWDSPVTDAAATKVNDMLNDGDPMKRAMGLLTIMQIAFYSSRGRLPASEAARPESLQKRNQRRLREWRRQIIPLRESEELFVQVAALWAMAWLAESTTWPPSQVAALVPGLVSLWRGSESPDVQYLSAWTLASLPLVSKRRISVSEGSSALGSFLAQKRSNPVRLYETMAALTAAYYFGIPWNDAELADLAKKEEKSYAPVSAAWERKVRKLAGRQVPS